MRALILLASLTIGATVSAQQASYTYVDQPPPYSNPPTPLLIALNTPRIGTTFQVQVTRSWHFGWAHGPWWRTDSVLITGFRNPALDLGYGMLFSSGDVVTPAPSGLGAYATLSFAVPATSSLIGVSFYQQAVGLHYVANSGSPGRYYLLGIELSRGGHGVIGT